MPRSHRFLPPPQGNIHHRIQVPSVPALTHHASYQWLLIAALPRDVLYALAIIEVTFELAGNLFEQEATSSVDFLPTASLETLASTD